MTGLTRIFIQAMLYRERSHMPHVERQVDHGAAARRLWQKIDKAVRLPSPVTHLLSAGVHLGPVDR